ncbi:hypothetical protein CXG81DRAFT_27549 [Caulochytrium protostelioides]|uniref:Ribosomal protein S24/S35 mitochondrial conserved domain-containing protein n=1 Tax=Caulochytrium protostelioides TaxID=1555241 RepID=A0A4P9X3T8_9FUNG|nr:hypothetical protein CXG81DRAFT_27549 [Caulochytrium protostelioides]|eukprot:RKO99707.1 hypothetical protein CXG81DRAFT_27549 [Caulochytrium protostelioides]
MLAAAAGRRAALSCCLPARATASSSPPCAPPSWRALPSQRGFSTTPRARQAEAAADAKEVAKPEPEPEDELVEGKKKKLKPLTADLSKELQVKLEAMLPKSSAHRLDFTPMTGEIDVDGVHSFDMDLLETIDWTKTLIGAMQDAPAALEPAQKAFARQKADGAVRRPGAQYPLSLQTASHFQYDFSKPPPATTLLTLRFRVADVFSATGAAKDATPQQLAEQRRVAKLVLGEAYDAHTDVATLSKMASLKPTDVHRTGPDMTAFELVASVNALVAQVREAASANVLADTPLDLSHVSLKPRPLTFPSSWRAPAPATTAAAAESAASTSTSATA